MSKVVLLLIFILALAIRFLYFPDNTYFAYDSARDSYGALDILKGNLKIVGPPTSLNDNLFHGVIFYYLLAPVYFFSGHSPEAASALLRIVNAAGVFITFFIASALFNKYVGLLSAFLFAISYEQSQYSLIFGHPSPTSITVLIFYLGLTLLIFKKKQYGLALALVGLGLSIQLEGVYALLVAIFILLLFVYKKQFGVISHKWLLFSMAAFLLTTITFILAEIKFNFRSSKAILEVANAFLIGGGGNSSNFIHIISVIQRFIKDNLVAEDRLISLVLVLIVLSLYFFRKAELGSKIIFLLLWFIGGLLPSILSSRFSYYYSGGATVSLLVLMSFIIYRTYLKWRIAAMVLVLVIVFSNFSLILKNNPTGPNPDIIIQPGMLIASEKKVLDYIYREANGQPFSVNALTIPLNISTTWSYLFEWYGKSKYGYLPVWGSEAAIGFPGNLKVETARSKLPANRFTIIEPPIGIDDYHKNNFFEQENYFSKVIEEKTFGTIKVQKREAI